jgi:hypothetical protein
LMAAVASEDGRTMTPKSGSSRPLVGARKFTKPLRGLSGAPWKGKTKIYTVSYPCSAKILQHIN